MKPIQGTDKNDVCASVPQFTFQMDHNIHRRWNQPTRLPKKKCRNVSPHQLNIQSILFQWLAGKYCRKVLRDLWCPEKQPALQLAWVSTKWKWSSENRWGSITRTWSECSLLWIGPWMDLYLWTISSQSCVSFFFPCQINCSRFSWAGEHKTPLTQVLNAEVVKIWSSCVRMDTDL